MMFAGPRNENPPPYFNLLVAYSDSYITVEYGDRFLHRMGVRWQTHTGRDFHEFRRDTTGAGCGPNDDLLGDPREDGGCFVYSVAYDRVDAEKGLGIVVPRSITFANGGPMSAHDGCALALPRR